MDDKSREMFGNLFGLIKFGVEFGEPHEPGPFVLSGFADDGVLIRGEAFVLLEGLQRHLASSALASGGPSREFVGDLVVRACRVARTSGLGEGLSWLEEKLTEGDTSWQVIEQVSGYFPMAPRRVGRATLHSALPPELGDILGDPRFLEVQVDRPMLIADVIARDRESAERRARDVFDEARSLLTIACNPQAPHAPLIAIGGSSRATSSSGHSEDFHLSGSALDHPMVRGLEDAAAKDPEIRTDWERRCLAACRWFRKAFVTDWPSEALAASMTVFECLFIEGKGVLGKGQAIADRIAPKWRLPDLGEEAAMHKWLVDMYGRRNAAVHEGAHYLEDFEVQRLVVLVEHSVRWAAWHLDPDHEHHLPERPCTSFAEVHAQ
ncbi:MAG TPA: hypothetical protein VK277_09470 [Acidimicrobiales bacterium]|nr:hypothetical protein [Acidimicrobiales bacterium]